jgi:hypothetical protein
VTSTIYHPGQKVPQSGLYEVVDRIGIYVGQQDTCVKDDTFPPVRTPREHGYVLADAAVHES